VREGVEPVSGEDPYLRIPFAEVWTRGLEADAGRIELAGAMLAADAPSSDEPLAILRKHAGEPGTLALGIELMRAFAEGDLELWGDLEKTSQEMLKRHPDSEMALTFWVTALSETGRWREIRDRMDERLRKDPQDDVARRMKATALGVIGDYSGSLREYDVLIDGGRGEAADMNNASWIALFLGPPDEKVIDRAQRAVKAESTESAFLHTLATVYAEAGRGHQARQVLFQALEADSVDEPRPHDYYVLGRIAESWGENVIAGDCYRRVEKEEGANSTFALAQRRLKGLPPAPAAPASPPPTKAAATANPTVSKR
jgi:hypothetical protein